MRSPTIRVTVTAPGQAPRLDLHRLQGQFDEEGALARWRQRLPARPAGEPPLWLGWVIVPALFTLAAVIGAAFK